MDNALNVLLNSHSVKTLQGHMYAFKNVNLLVLLAIEISVSHVRLDLF